MKEFVEKLIKLLKDEEREYRRRWKYKGENEEDWQCMKAMQKAIGIVEQLAEEHDNGWISVEDELPKDKADVLVWLRSQNMHCVAWYNSAAKTWYSNDFVSEDSNYVTAWQPLPAPYKKGE